jgi:hypothetical protein
MLSASSADKEREPLLNHDRPTVNGNGEQRLHEVVDLENGGPQDLPTAVRDAQRYAISGFKLPEQEPREDVVILIKADDERLEEIDVSQPEEDLNKVLQCLQYLSNQPNSVLRRVLIKQLTQEFGRDPNTELEAFQSFLISRALEAAKNEGPLQNYLGDLKDKIDDLQGEIRKLINKIRQDQLSHSNQFQLDKAEFLILLRSINTHLEQEQSDKLIAESSESKAWYQKPHYWHWIVHAISGTVCVGLASFSIWVYFYKK